MALPGFRTLYSVCTQPFVQMNFPINIDTIIIGLPISYSKYRALYGFWGSREKGHLSAVS